MAAQISACTRSIGTARPRSSPHSLVPPDAVKTRSPSSLLKQAFLLLTPTGTLIHGISFVPLHTSLTPVGQRERSGFTSILPSVVCAIVTMGRGLCLVLPHTCTPFLHVFPCCTHLRLDPAPTALNGSWISPLICVLGLLSTTTALNRAEGGKCY